MLYGNKQNGETTAYRIDKITGTIDTSFVQIFCNYGNDIKSNMYAAKNRFGVNLESNVFNIRFLTEKYPNVNSVKKRIQEYPVILYYPLGTIIEEQITDTNLISQLNTILNYLISLELKGQEYILTLEDYIPITKTGSDITYDNTINARFTNFKIKGNAGTSTEQSFEICGKNLLKLQNKYIYPNNKAILNIKNGKISFVNDSNKQYIGFYITNGNIKNVVKGYTNTKKYYISADVTVTSPTTIQLIGKNISVEENKKTRISADYPENSTNAITFYDMGGNNDDTERTVTFENIQICTQEDYNYEPYQGQTLPLTLPTATGDFTIENKDNNWYYNDTIITDKTLLQQLTNLSKSTSYSGITNIITTADVPAELEVTALTK